jgi:hypothetical protein
MSGFAEGGSFAHRMHIAYSSVVKGVSLMNSTPYTMGEEDEELTLEELSG